MTTIGIIGAGHIGQAVAEAVIAKGHDVVIANSRGPETLGAVIDQLGEQATAGTIEDAAGAGEILLLAIPLGRESGLDPALFAGKLVIDADNYYPQRDGEIAEVADGSTTSAARLQALLPDARIVKAFNHIYARQIVTDASASGTPGRRALAIYGDDEAARATVSALLDEIGFDAVDGGPLAESWRIQVGQPGYVTRDTAAELEAHLAAATR